MKRLAAIVVIVGVLLAGCGSSKKDPTTTKQTTTTAAAGGDSEAKQTEPGFAAKLLTVADLPSGFEASEVFEQDGSIGENSSGGICDAFDAAAKRYPPKHEAEVDFNKNDPSSVDSVSVVSAVSRYESDAAATKALNEQKAAFASCQNVAAGEGDAHTTGTMTTRDYAAGGSAGWLAHLDATQSESGLTVKLVGDFLSVRKGAYLVSLSVFEVGSITFAGDINALATKAIAKI